MLLPLVKGGFSIDHFNQALGQLGNKIFIFEGIFHCYNRKISVNSKNVKILAKFHQTFNTKIGIKPLVGKG